MAVIAEKGRPSNDPSSDLPVFTKTAVIKSTIILYTSVWSNAHIRYVSWDPISAEIILHTKQSPKYNDC